MPAFDVVFIGCGPGGCDGAVRAAQFGGKVCVIEKRDLGGTCVNRGCIPTKSLLASAHLYAEIQRADEFGLHVDNASFDFAKVMERKATISGNISQSIGALLEGYGVEIIRGEGRVAEPGLVEIKTEDGRSERIGTRNIIVATGSEPGYIPIFKQEAGNVINSDTALSLTELPKSIVIIGGGVIGTELGCVFNAFGVDVTIVEILPYILSTEDGQIARTMQGILRRRGIDIFVKAKITEAIDDGNQVTVSLASGETIEAEKALLCVGRARNSSDLGLERLGIEIQRGRVIVDEKMETSLKGIYAIGDVSTSIQLAHVATFEGYTAAANSMGKETAMNYDAVPSAIYTWPEIAGVGLRTEQARKLGIRPKIGRFLYVSSGRAVTSGENEGFVKILADPETDKILGVHIIGANASEMIHEATVARRHGLTVQQLAETIHAHPTLSEAIMEAAEDVHDMSVHTPST